MKRTRVFLAVLIAAVMMTALGSTAFAFAPQTGPYNITIDNTANENSQISAFDKFYAFKVFDVTLGGEETTATSGGGTETTYTAYAYTIKSSSWAWSTLIDGAVTDSTTGVITTQYGIELRPSIISGEYIVNGESMTEANARAMADALTGHLPPLSQADGRSVNVTATDLTNIPLSQPGYYAVYGQLHFQHNNYYDKIIAALSLTTTDPDVTVYVKAQPPHLEKKIAQVEEATSSGTQVTDAVIDDSNGRVAVAKVGSVVTFELDSIVPDVTGYTDYQFIIRDTMSDGLTFFDPEGAAENDVTVTIDGVDKTSVCEITISGQNLTIKIPHAVLEANDPRDEIKVTYNAVVNSGALTTDYEKNTAWLTFSNDPTTDSSSTTVSTTVYVLDFSIMVEKNGGASSGNPLAGASFKMYRILNSGAGSVTEYYRWDAANGAVAWTTDIDEADTFTTDSSGFLTELIGGLDIGTYYLLETAAPTGYNPLTEPIEVEVTADMWHGNSFSLVYHSDWRIYNDFINLYNMQSPAQPVVLAHVINNAGTVLPSTGGSGTGIYCAFGGILLMGAWLLLILRKRSDSLE